MLRAAVAAIDPDVLEAETSARLVQDFAEIERLAAAGKALAARRMAASGVWRKDGDRSAAQWMARHTGTSVGHAGAPIETAQRLEELLATEEAALRKGELSEVQVKEIASAAAADPSAEGELLGVAARDGVATLREQCARVKAAASNDDNARYVRIHRARYLRQWSDAEGAFRLDARLTPDAGRSSSPRWNLSRTRSSEMHESRDDGNPTNAHAADALVEMAKHVRACSTRRLSPCLRLGLR